MSKLNNKSSRRVNHRALFVCAAAALTAVAAGAQQIAPPVPSRVDDTSISAQRRAAAISASGVITVPEGFENLKLAPGYLLSMDVYDVPEMSAQLRIDAQGFVAVPLAGPVHVAGLSVPEAQHAITQALVSREILKSAEVTLNVLQFSSKYVTVLGEVQTPGRIQLLEPQPLANVLALAGGETTAAGNDIEIQHLSAKGDIRAQHVDYAPGVDPAALQNVEVAPGDSVVVHRAGIVYVLGAVNRPGGYLMSNGGTLSVIQAVSMAGGTTLQAASKSAVIVRKKGDSYVQFKVPLNSMETGASAPVQLEVNDALYIPVSSWKAVVVNGSNVLSAATSAAIYRAP